MTKTVAVVLRPNQLAFAVASAFLSAGVAAQTAPGTLPTGPEVTSGSAKLTYTPDKLQIDQSTNRAILQWDRFSIGSNAWVNFSQPSAASVALNRVMGTSPSEIFGRLTANGQVFLSNPNGVLFAPGASVDVGGLFATTLSIADRDFLAGRYNFYNPGGARSVVNQGVITATGYAALAGPQVKNEGVIIARAGTVALAAGDRVSLDMVGDGLIKVSVDQAALNASAINSGRIEADGGNVILTARSANALLDTVINNTGIIRANSLIERNGEIVLDGGNAGVVANSGTLQAAGVAPGSTGGVIRVFGDRIGVSGLVDASGDAGGGSITIGAQSSTATFIAAGTTIRADATGEGSGGFVETSGRYLEVNSAPQIGAGGTWLIDPFNIEIVDGSGMSNNTGPATFTPNGDNSQIGAALINNQLNAGASVTIDTGSAGSPGTQAGDLLVNGTITKTSVNGAGLTLSAFRDLQINRNVSMANGALTFNAGRITNNAAVSTTGGNTLLNSDAFSLSGGTINGGTGAVILRPRTGTNSFGIEAAGTTTVTNADIASISTSDFVVFGSGSVFTGNMAIGANAQVNGGGKNLAFFRANPGTTTLGPFGVTTTGNVIVSAGGGALDSNGGIVAGNQVQLRASTGIGSAASRVNTSSNVLAVNTGGSAFVNATGPVTLNNVNFVVGGNTNNSVQNFAGGAYDLTASNALTVTGVVTGGTMSIDAAGPLKVLSTGSAVASLNANAGQTIKAGSLEITADGVAASILNSSGVQNVTVAGGISLQNSTTNVTNSFAGIQGPTQTITAGGDVTLKANFATGTSQGVRIGGLGGVPGSDTNLTLTSTNGNVVLTGGTGAGNGASLGSTVASVHPSTVTVNATRGQVIMNSGADGGARIGNALGLAAGGDITINAGGLQMNGTANPTSIRTQGNVTLNLGSGSVTQASNGVINANTLTVKAGSASLTGPNAISTISAPLQPGNAPGVTGNFNLNNTAALTVTDLRAGGAVTLTNAGTITLNASGTQDARITSVGGQTITADGLILNAQDGRVANINNVSGNQSIVTGAGGVQLNVATNGQGVAQISNNRGAVTSGTQTVQTSGALNVVGGSTTTGSTNSGIFQMQTGKQSVAAGSISLAAANAPVNAGGAFISNTNIPATLPAGDQEITVTNGGITLNGGGTGNANRAGIATNGNQTISGNPDILITGGSSGIGTGGNANSAFITAGGTGKTQTINAGNIILKAGPGGTDTSATITGTKQVITATGDARITGSDGNSGDSNGARIGGLGGNTPSATDLSLTARDVILTAGAAASGAALGSSNNATTPPDNNITVNARDVILNASDTNGVRIGTNSDFATPAAGNISVIATRDIALNGTAAHAAAIRTTGNVTLQAERNLSSTTNGYVVANGLAVKSTTGSTSLTGPNKVSFLSGTSAAALSFANAAPLTVNGPLSSGAAMDLNVAGMLSVVGNAGTPALISSIGGQNITAASLDVRSNGANATVTNNGGNQTITVNGGAIDVHTVAPAGFAQILQNGAGVQTVTANGADHIDVIAEYGNASIQAVNGGSQVVSITGAGAPGSGGIHLANSSSNFVNSFAGINAAQQNITASGDITLTANFATGTSHGVRIGGIGGAAGTDTNLTLTSTGGNVVLNGGAGAANGAAIGSTVAGAHPSTITINAQNGNVILNPGAEGGARIGYAPGLPAGGDITINAAGVQLNGGAQPTSIRTQGTVNLNIFSGAVTEGSNGSIIAGTLNVNAQSASLGGPNQIGTLSAQTFGDFSLVNSGALTVNSLNAGTSSLTNTGAVTVSGLWMGGPMTLNVSDALNVQNGALQASGNQSLSAGSLSVTGQNGSASIVQSGSGTQSIVVTGGSIDIQALGTSGSAFVTSSGVQNVSLVNGDHISVNGASGTALLQAFLGTQNISATGTGRNAITVGSAGARGASNVAALNQTVTAGNSGESGSITIVGSAAPSALAGFVTSAGAGGTQTLSTAGRISITGGSAAAQLFNFPAGIFHNGSGAQTIDAAGITILGGNAGNGNAALINSGGGGVAANAGNQVINLHGGDLTITAGSAGSGNRAGVTSGANQTINDAGAITVTGGAGGSGAGTSNTSNNTFLSANTAGRVQTIHASSITVNAGLGGNDTSATITGARQAITASGDVTLNGGGGTGSANGARIGGPSGAATNLVLSARNVTLKNGSVSGAGIGSSIVGAAQPNTITVNASGDVVLNDGTGAGARIGSSSINGTAGGDIVVNAGGNIALNGVDRETSIRTTGSVTLSAGGSITEAAQGLVIAGSLATTSGASTSLGGPNQLGAFNASAGGDVLLVNTGALNVTGLSAGGNATLDNTGNVTLSGPWTAGGTTNITVHSDLVLRDRLTSQDVLLTATSGSIREDGAGAISAGALTTSSVGDTVLGGANSVGTFSASSQTGSVALVNSGALTLGSIAAPAGFDLANTGTLSFSGPVSTAGTLALATDGDLNLTQALQAGELRLTSSTGSITSAAGVALTADTLRSNSAHDTTLLGANAVHALDAQAGGALRFNTTGSLTVLGVRAADAGITAAGAIGEAAGGAIVAPILTTSSGGATLLGGANQVGKFTASAGGDVLLTNASPVLSLGAMSLPAALTINQTGALSLTTGISSLSQSYAATGDIQVGNASASASTVLAASGAMTMSSGGGILLRGSDTSAGVSAIVSGGTVKLSSAGDLRLLGGAAAGSQALVLGGSTIDLHVGGVLALDGTSDNGSWARVQTATTSGQINVYFPSVSSGGYSVDGFQRLKHGEDGFFTGDKPAKAGTSLFLHYGL